MSAPWEILGLARGCSQKELRDAYARLLKQHRPDQDPEGFRRVRDAYEWMRQNFEDANASPDTIVIYVPANPESDPQDDDEPEPDATTHSAPAPAPAAAPEGLRKPLFERIEVKLAEARRKNQPRRERRMLRRLLKYWRAKTTPADEWDRLLVAQLQRPDGAILELITPEDAALDVRRGGMMVSVELIRVYAKRAMWPQLQLLLTALEKELPLGAAASVLLIGIKHIAILDWKRAQALTNSVFPHLSEHARNAELGDVDRLIQAGKELGTLVPKCRSVLANCLANGSADPHDDNVTQAIRSVSMLTNAPSAKMLFKERFPVFKDRLHFRMPAAAGAAAASRSRSRSSSSSGTGSYWWVAVMVIMCLRTLGSCSSSSSSNSSRPTYSPPSFKPPVVIPNPSQDRGQPIPDMDFRDRLDSLDNKIENQNPQDMQKWLDGQKRPWEPKRSETPKFKNFPQPDSSPPDIPPSRLPTP